MTSARVALRVTVGAFSALFFLGTSAVQPVHAQTEIVLYNFTIAASRPSGALVRDSAGNLYGTTVGGFYPAPYGAVYELLNSSGNYTEKILYVFGTTSSDALNPYAGVIMDSAGNLYGTTNKGGSAGTGTVFEVVNSGGNYTEKILYSFGSATGDGVNPRSALLMDSAGNLFGATTAGGTSGFGTVFELVNTSGSYTEKVLYSFAGPPGDGEGPTGLLMDSAGNLYGATGGGGTNDDGVIFELVNASGSYSEKLLYSFAGPPNDGKFPMGLVMDASGNLYGTTSTGGASSNCCGTVFELVNSSGNYTEKILYSFISGADGPYPTGAPILDATGKLFGTAGGGKGTVFELTNSSGSFQEYVLHAFTGSPGDGAIPAGLTIDSTGNLYGITVQGGQNGYDNTGGGYGTVFEIPNASALSVIFTPTGLNFGGRLIGTPGTNQSVTVNNISAASLTFGANAVTRSGPNSSDFAITSDACSGKTLAAAGTCTVSVTFASSILGSEAASLSFADNAFGNPQTVPLSGIGQDFSLTPIDTTQTVSRGNTANFNFYMNPLGGFTGSVTIACSGLPPNSTCVAGPPVASLDGILPQNSGINIWTNGSGEAVPRWRGPFSPPPAALWFVFGAAAALYMLTRKRARIGLLAPLALLVFVESCGATGGGGGHPGYHNPPTPTGTYTITISGSSGGLTRSINVTLIVQ